jgi:uncharacterized protein
MIKNFRYCWVLLGVIIVLVSASVLWSRQPIANNQPASNLPIDMQFEKLEIARSLDEQRIGLMNRQELCNKCGMLFVFNQPQILEFWMKNTYVKIDIIYLDNNLRVVKLISQPLTNNETITYPSGTELSLALEIPSERTKQLGIREGSILKFDY